MSKTATIKSDENTFLIRLVERGDTYGAKTGPSPGMCWIHDKEGALLEFYDYDFDFDYDGNKKLGQFISRYYISTLRSSYTPATTIGLNLHGGVPKWTINAQGMNQVMRFVDEQAASEPEQETLAKAA